MAALLTLMKLRNGINMFGLFSTPKCPRCGRKATIDTDGLRDFWTCVPCRNKLQKEKKEKQDLLKRVKELEEKIKDK